MRPRGEKRREAREGDGNLINRSNEGDVVNKGSKGHMREAIYSSSQSRLESQTEEKSSQHTALTSATHREKRGEESTSVHNQ